VQTRIRALHRACPCAAPFAVYERYMDEVRRLKKDPSRAVRRVAVHVEQDAGGVERIEARLDRAEEIGARFADRDFCQHWRRRRERAER
jgi:hypothetical protein